MSLSRLDKGKGFSLDLRPPNPDPIAKHFAYKWFGQGVVDRVRDKYHRARLSGDAIKEDLMEFDVKHVPRVTDDTYLSVLESVRRDFVPEELIIPWTLGHVEIDGTPKDKSPGLPWKERGYGTKKDVLECPDALNEIHKIWSLIGKGYKHTIPDAMVYCRAQICKRDKNKIRATFGYPMEATLEEGRFVYPYLKWIRHSNKDVPVAYGIEMATGGMGYIDEAFTVGDSNTKCAMLDWKRFDKPVPPWLIRDAFDVLAQAFDFSKVLSSDGRVWPVDPERSKRRWKKIINYFINTPLRLSNGERFQKHGGVPSGSTWTNIIDTIINAITTRYCVFHTTGHFPLHDIYMGDDSCIMLNRGIDLTAFADVALSSFGFILNQDKSYITGVRTNIQFLGYYNYYGRPMRDMDFLIASFIYPERFHGVHDPQFSCTRAVGQMWSTLNGSAALRWLDLIEDMEKHFRFDDTWFAEFIESHPTTLKYLRLTGLEPSALHVPKRGSWLLTEVEPPVRSRRTPAHRTYDMNQLYQNYFANYKTEHALWSQFTDDRIHPPTKTDP